MTEISHHSLLLPGMQGVVMEEYQNTTKGFEKLADEYRAANNYLVAADIYKTIIANAHLYVAASAKSKLGVMYYRGEGVEKDVHKALKLQEEAAPHFPKAAFEAGWLYIDGRGIERDVMKALHYFKIAADDAEQKPNVLKYLKEIVTNESLTLQERFKISFAAAILEDPAMDQAAACLESIRPIQDLFLGHTPS